MDAPKGTSRSGAASELHRQRIGKHGDAIIGSPTLSKTRKDRIEHVALQPVDELKDHDQLWTVQTRFWIAGCHRHVDDRELVCDALLKGSEDLRRQEARVPR